MTSTQMTTTSQQSKITNHPNLTTWISNNSMYLAKQQSPKTRRISRLTWIETQLQNSSNLRKRSARIFPKNPNPSHLKLLLLNTKNNNNRNLQLIKGKRNCLKILIQMKKKMMEQLKKLKYKRISRKNRSKWETLLILLRASKMVLRQRRGKNQTLWRNSSTKKIQIKQNKLLNQEVHNKQIWVLNHQTRYQNSLKEPWSRKWNN